MVAENILTPADFILPLFVCEGRGKINAIDSMPGVYRYSVDQLAPIVEEASSLGVAAYAIFPEVDPADKTPDARESYNPDNLICRSIRAIRASHPEVGIICDAALDPFNSDGHDGLLVDGHVINDESVEILCRQSVVQAEAGCHVIAPSDMMDGRVGAIRRSWMRPGLKEFELCLMPPNMHQPFTAPFEMQLGRQVL